MKVEITINDEQINLKVYWSVSRWDKFARGLSQHRRVERVIQRGNRGKVGWVNVSIATN